MLLPLCAYLFWHWFSQLLSTAPLCGVAALTPTCMLDSELNRAMHIITGCLKNTPTPMLYVLANVAPPPIRRDALVLKSAWKALADPLSLLHDIIATPAKIHRQLQPPTRKSARLNLALTLVSSSDYRRESLSSVLPKRFWRILARLALSQQINARQWLTSLSWTAGSGHGVITMPGGNTSPHPIWTL